MSTTNTPSGTSISPGFVAVARSTRHCTCQVCIARTVKAARKRLRRGDVQIAILELLQLDLPASWFRCKGNADQGARIAELEARLREVRGWAHAYATQEAARLAMGPACPCLWRGAKR